ncbi:hypothetical protein MJ904_25240 [Massilia sp. MB5]|uniref:hypothetical protein n=1 Tax=Massilia sp. MB5 TaxID=2919578 RepID=UPI001F10F70D|nr:hypothetical protein [Massilia sp. MB5]UMR30257.1 hypothetical protein MJ904_25240 [Massilia sp. MB5]
MPVFSVSAFRRIVRASAVYDVLLTAAFATPWTFALAHGQLSALNQVLGGAALPAFSAFHILFACLLGSVVLVWSVLRIRDPQPRFGRYDAVARLLFSLWMLWALVQTGAPLLWLFLLPEAAWGVVQALPPRREMPV